MISTHRWARNRDSAHVPGRVPSRGQRAQTSLSPRNKLQRPLCAAPKFRVTLTDPKRWSSRDVSRGNPKRQLPKLQIATLTRPPLSRGLHTHSPGPSRQTPRSCSLGRMCRINLNLKRNTQQQKRHCSPRTWKWQQQSPPLTADLWAARLKWMPHLQGSGDCPRRA